jgi:hypothetical protein
MTHKPDSLVVRKGRRLFLAGSAGLVALPFLESLARPSPARAWAPAAGMPKRLIMFFNGHGLIMEDYVPRAGFAQGAILRPVADAGLASKMLVVTGVNSKVQSGHPGAPSVLTCTPMIADMYGITHPTTQSVDHLIARHMQDGGAPRRFDVGIEDSSTNLSASSLSGDHSQMFWSGDDEHISSIVHPHFALDRAFPMGSEPGTPSVDARLVRRRSVLDGALAQFDRLRGRVSASDRSRLDRHADHLRSIETSLGGMVGPVGPSCTRPTFESPATHARAAEILVDTLALAMACNRADVGTFKAFDLEEAAWGHITHPDLASTFAGENYHGAWHRASDMRVASARRAFTAIDTWFGTLFARLMQRLNEVDEGDGTALDNTMLVWVSDFGHGGGHGSDNLPITFAGNAGGVALGRHVNYATNPESSYGEASQPGNHNLCVTMQQAFGITSDRFGDYTNVAQPVGHGPLSLG